MKTPTLFELESGHPALYAPVHSHVGLPIVFADYPISSRLYLIMSEDYIVFGVTELSRDENTDEDFAALEAILHTLTITSTDTTSVPVRLNSGTGLTLTFELPIGALVLPDSNDGSTMFGTSYRMMESPAYGWGFVEFWEHGARRLSPDADAFDVVRSVGAEPTRMTVSGFDSAAFYEYTDDEASSTHYVLENEYGIIVLGLSSTLEWDPIQIMRTMVLAPTPADTEE